ncbi:unnamed protein product [Polarella glacialis]|uniref:Uncharacterized protein n=1 Tax=Polarella glacialis TaxID=89957 RepID=A0A813G9M7_POLGL|nr:unnamed protein product [Polarella glacialis]
MTADIPPMASLPGSDDSSDGSSKARRQRRERQANQAHHDLHQKVCGVAMQQVQHDRVLYEVLASIGALHYKLDTLITSMTSGCGQVPSHPSGTPPFLAWCCCAPVTSQDMHMNSYTEPTRMPPTTVKHVATSTSEPKLVSVDVAAQDSDFFLEPPHEEHGCLRAVSEDVAVQCEVYQAEAWSQCEPLPQLVTCKEIQTMLGTIIKRSAQDIEDEDQPTQVMKESSAFNNTENLEAGQVVRICQAGHSNNFENGIGKGLVGKSSGD